MADFWQNFKHGFMHGTFNGMFGGFGTFNFASWNCMPQFFTGNFMNMSVFRYNSPLTMLDKAWYGPQTIDFGINYQNFEYAGPNYTYDYNWGDTFTKKEKNKIENEPEKSNIEKQPNDVINEEPSTYNCNAQELKKKWDKKKPGLSIEFFEKVVNISKKIKCSPEDLMAVMHSESAGTFNPGEWNHAGNRAVGLIQFTDIAAKSLDPTGELTLEKLAKMSAIEQLNYVEKYLEYAKCKVAKFDKSDELTAGDLYSIVYLPAVAKKDVLAEASNDPKEYYSKNKIFDRNKDGKITKSEMAEQVKVHRA